MVTAKNQDDKNPNIKKGQYQAILSINPQDKPKKLKIFIGKAR